MTDAWEAARRPRAPMPPHVRRRWAVAAGVAGVWVLLLAVFGSVLAATALLLLLAALGAAAVAGLRSMGVAADPSWIGRLAGRPDGQATLRRGLRRAAEVFVISPSGVLLAPNALELRLSPRDFGSLNEQMEAGMINASAAEAYEEQVAANGARFTGPGPAEVSVSCDPELPPGRSAVRPGRPGARPGPGLRAMQPGPAGGFRYGQDGRPRAGDAMTATGDLAVGIGSPTVAEVSRPAIPPLRLVTGDHVAETRMSGARAGRGAVELGLPPVPTVSREHARFTFAGGQWRVISLGRNGLTLNGVPLAGDQAVRDGDSIRWGRRQDALLSRVEIG